MGYTEGKLEVSLTHSYESGKHTLILSPASISKIETLFNITLGSCAGSTCLKCRYLSESKRKELLNIYERDIILFNSVNDAHGDYFKYVDPIEAALSKHGIYDISVEYDPPQDCVAQPVTPQRPKGIFEQLERLWIRLVPEKETA